MREEDARCVKYTQGHRGGGLMKDIGPIRLAAIATSLSGEAKAVWQAKRRPGLRAQNDPFFFLPVSRAFGAPNRKEKKG